MSNDYGFVPDAPTPAAAPAAKNYGFVPDDAPAPSGAWPVIGKALDYQRGALSPLEAGTVSALSQFTNHPHGISDLLKPGEWEKAYTGGGLNTTQAPKGDEMLERAGFQKGSSLSENIPGFQSRSNTYGKYNPLQLWPTEGGALDVTPRGVAGGLLDMAHDPLTYETALISKGLGVGANALKSGLSSVSEVPVLGTLANGVGKAASTAAHIPTALSDAIEAWGKHNYETGLAPLIAKGEKYGKDVADTYFKNGIWGSGSTISDMASSAADALKAKRDALMQMVQSKIDETKAPFTPIEPRPPSYQTQRVVEPSVAAVQPGLGRTVLPGEEKIPTDGTLVSGERWPDENIDLGASHATIGYHEQGSLGLMDREPTQTIQLGEDVATPGEHEQLAFPEGKYRPSGPEQLAPSGLNASKQRGQQAFEDFLNYEVGRGNLARADADRMLAKEVSTTAGNEAPTLSDMSSWKTRSYNNAKANSFAENAHPDIAKQGEIAKGAGYRQEIQNTMNKAMPGTGDELENINDELGNFLTVQTDADRIAATETKRKFLVPQDMRHMGTSLNASGDVAKSTIPWMASKAAQVWNSPMMRTSTGYWMRKAGGNVFLSHLMDSAAINTLRSMAGKDQPVAGAGQ